MSVLLAFAAIAPLLAMGDPLEGDGIMCNEPGFTVARSGRTAVLSGQLSTPMQGYAYRFQLLGWDHGIAGAVISAGQPVNYNGFGRGLPAIGQLVVKEKFQIPTDVQQLNVRIEGLSQKPREFICSFSAPQQRS